MEPSQKKQGPTSFKESFAVNKPCFTKFWNIHFEIHTPNDQHAFLQSDDQGSDYAQLFGKYGYVDLDNKTQQLNWKYLNKKPTEPTEPTQASDFHSSNQLEKEPTNLDLRSGGWKRKNNYIKSPNSVEKWCFTMVEKKNMLNKHEPNFPCDY